MTLYAARVRIGEAVLPVPAASLAALAEAYGGLGLPVSAVHDRSEVVVGESRLRFETGDGSPFHHFALLVPGDRWDAALAWAAGRLDLLLGASGETVFRFDFWDARAVYFHDPGGNIVELIAHRGVAETGRRGPFAGEELVGLSELGLVADPATAVAGLPLPLWAGTPDRPDALAFVGEKARTLVIARPGRGWLPTGRPAEPHPVEVVIVADRAAVLDLEGHLIRLVREVGP